jgi:hypothetical protein
MQWANGQKIFKRNPQALKAIQAFMDRKPGATLDVLTRTELDAFKIKAQSLNVSLQR